MNPYSEKLTDLYQLLVENTNSLLIVLDRDSVIRAINKSFRTMLDIANEREAIGKKFSDLAEMETLHSIIFQSLDTGEEFNGLEFWISLKGQSLFFTIDTKLIRDITGMTTQGIMCIIRNLTDKKIEEQKLLTLEKQAVIGRLAAGIAHEIRNPLTAASGFVQLLLQGTVNEKQRMYLEHVRKEHMRMSKLISDFMVLAKPAQLDFREISVTQIIRETVDLMQAQAILNDVLIEPIDTDINAIVLADGEQLKQVFINLLRNAIEATEKANAIITVSVEIMTATIRISVQDEGIGIPQEHIPRIFDPFFTTKKDGTGIGLTGVYQIVKNHNGDITVESVEGKGTTFIITFPLIQVS